MSTVKALTVYCECVVERLCGIENTVNSSIFESFKFFCKRWLPDPQSFLDNDVLTTFDDGLQFLLSEVLGWSERDFFESIKDINISRETSDPRIKCFALLLAVACALRMDSARTKSDENSELFSDKLHEVLADRDDQELFLGILRSLCWTKSAADFCSDSLFKYISEDRICETSPPLSPSLNQTVSALDMSCLDLNKSMAASPVLRERTRQLRASTRSRVESGTSEADEDKSAVFSSSMNKSFADGALLSMNIPPLCNPRLSQSSPYAKLAQKNRNISVKYNLLSQEMDELRADLNYQKEKNAAQKQDNDRLTKQISLLSSELMDCRDEKNALQDSFKAAEQELTRLREKVDKLKEDMREMECEKEDMLKREKHLNTQLDLVNNEKYSAERRQALLAKEKAEALDWFKCEGDNWRKTNEDHLARIKSLEEALKQEGERKRDLTRQLNEAKDENIELQSDFHFKFSTETFKLEEKLAEKEAEFDEVKGQLTRLEKQSEEQVAEIEQLRREKQMLEHTVDTYKESEVHQLASMKTAEEQMQARIEHLLSTNKNTENTCAQLKSQLAQVTGKLKTSQEECAMRLKEQVDLGQAKVDQVRREIEEMGKSHKQQMANNAEIMQQLKEAEQKKSSEIVILNLKVAQLENQVHAAEEKAVIAQSRLDAEMETVKEKTDEIEQLNIDLHKLNENFSCDIEKTKARHEEELKRLESLLEEKDGACEQSNERIAKLSEEMAQLRDAKSVLELEVQRKNNQLERENEDHAREIVRLNSENSSLASKIKFFENQLHSLNEESRKKERETVETMYQEMEQLRKQITRHNVEMHAKNYELSQMTSGKSEADKQIEQLKQLIQAEKETKKQEIDKLHLQITSITEEKQIELESMEVENRNLTDSLLQVTGEVETLAAQRDSLLMEQKELSQAFELAQAQAQRYLQQKQQLESDCGKLDALNRELQSNLACVTSAQNDERRLSDEEISALQLKVVEMEQQCEELQLLRGQLQTMEKSMKYTDRTLESFKKLYLKEKERNDQIAAAATAQNVKIKQEAQSSDSESGIFARRYTRQTSSASDLERKGSSDSMTRIPLGARTTNTGVSYSASTPLTSTMRLRNRAMASQNFADSVPNESLYKFGDILDMMPNMQDAVTRVSDLQRQENVYPKSLLNVSSFPVETINSHSSVNSTSTLSTSSSGSSTSWTSLQNAATSQSQAPPPNLPGYVPSSSCRNSSRRQSVYGESIAATTLGARRGTEEGPDWLSEEDRLNEIERRNSMYPRHLQSCYPMEHLKTAEGKSASLGRKRPVPVAPPKSEDNVNESQCSKTPSAKQVKLDGGETETAGIKTPAQKRGQGSPAKNATDDHHTSCAPSSLKKQKKASGMTPLTMPSPQKMLQKVTGRRSKVCPLPMNTVQENATELSEKPSSVFMEFPNTPKDKKRRKKSGAN